MGVVRRLTVLVCFALVSCGGTSATSTTTPDHPRTTITLPQPPTSAATLPVEVQGCSSPPITFSALCQVYELLQTWHVDQPLDPEWLAGLAITALDDDLGNLGKSPLPRTLFCAVPHPAYREFCDRLADVVAATGIEVGELMDHVVATMVEDGLGPFTYYLAPDQLTAFRGNGVVGGVGVLLDATDAAGSRCARLSPACPLKVVFVLEDNPGADAGLLAGDVIVEVDGTSVDGQGFAATAGHIAGDEQGQVSLTVERDGRRLTIDVDRGEVVVPTVEVDIPLPGVAYLRIPDFEEDMPVLVRLGLESLAASGAGTVVVDLRDNPGGYLASVVEVASEFIASGTVLVANYADDSEIYEVTGDGLAHDGRLIVLVNQGTASAAEILAGALRARRGAAIVGTSTFGKDAIQIPFDLRNGGELDIAVARWATPDGLTVGDGGLIPDRELELPVSMGIVELVEAALETLR